MAGKISISITDEHGALLQEGVGSGDCASTSEVIRETLREWRARRSLGQLWDEEVMSGPCEPGTTKADIRHEAPSRRTAC